MNKTTVVMVVVLSMLALGVMAGIALNKSKPSEVITIGAVLPMTGPAATFGKWGLAGLEMAIDDLNRSGGIRGRKLVVSLEDSGGEPSKAVAALKKLLAFSKLEIVFSIVSAVDLALTPIAEQEDIILFSHAAHPDITKSRNHVLRHSNTVAQESNLIIDYLTPSDVETGVSVLHLNDDYGTAFASQLTVGIRAKFPGRPVNVVSFGRDEPSFAPQVSAALKNHPSLVIVAGVGKS